MHLFKKQNFIFLYLAAFHFMNFSYSNYILNIPTKKHITMKYYADNNTYISHHMDILLVY